MPSLLAVFLAAATAIAWLLSRRRRSYRAVALLLSWALGSGLARSALQTMALQPVRAAIGPAPYPWPERLAFHAEQALLLSWPFAALAAVVWLFLRRPPWAVLAAWVATAAGISLAYPWLRLDALDVSNASVRTLALLTAVAAIAHSWQRGDRWSIAHWSVWCVLSIEASVLAVVLWWDAPNAHWEIARRIQKVGYGGLLSYQLWRLVHA